jgi:hypothetical protein
MGRSGIGLGERNGVELELGEEGVSEESEKSSDEVRRARKKGIFFEMSETSVLCR